MSDALNFLSWGLFVSCAKCYCVRMSDMHERKPLRHLPEGYEQPSEFGVLPIYDENKRIVATYPSKDAANAIPVIVRGGLSGWVTVTEELPFVHVHESLQ